MKKRTIADGIHWICSNIANDDLFEGLWPIPHGVSLNSYIVSGEKTALIDLVRDWDGAPQNLLEQLKELGLKPGGIDYLILNHLEPDHTGWLREFKELNPELRIVSTEKGINLVKEFYAVEDGLQTVKTGESLDLGGGKVLQFFEVPNVHWPETMVSYESESGVLFSCDAFGSFGAVGDAGFDDELSEEEHEFFEAETLRYYANIVASFSAFVLRAVEKLKDLDIKVIAPSHGIVWRKDPARIIERYVRYAEYLRGPCENEITLVWGTMYGNTGRLVQTVIETLKEEGVTVNVHQVPETHLSAVLASAWKSTGLILGMPTYEYKMFPPMANVVDIFERKHVKNKLVFRFGSFGWSGGAQRELDETVKRLKWDCLEALEFQGMPSAEDEKRARERARDLARRVKAALSEQSG